MFNYDGEYFVFNSQVAVNVDVSALKPRCSLLAGLTPLHTAVLAHNAVVKEQRALENPCPYMSRELARRRLMYVQCIKILLLMGASFGTRVIITTAAFFFCNATWSSVSVALISAGESLSCKTDNSASLFPQEMKSGRTCLHMAAEEANVELFQHLLDQSSSLSIVNVKVSCFAAITGCMYENDYRMSGN